LRRGIASPTFASRTAETRFGPRIGRVDFNSPGTREIPASDLRLLRRIKKICDRRSPFEHFGHKN